MESQNLEGRLDPVDHGGETSIGTSGNKNLTSGPGRSGVLSRDFKNIQFAEM